MRKYINITESLLEAELNSTAELLLAEVVDAYDADQADLTQLSAAIEHAREFLGKTPPHKRSPAFHQGFRDATSGKAFGPPLGETDKVDYNDGWALGRRRRGL